MPESNSPKMTMADEDGTDQDVPKRKWSCPPDDAVASYVDGTLLRNRKGVVEAHLARCERCRKVVADIIKDQREIDLPTPPSALAYKTIAAATTNGIAKRWVWIPAGAVATLAVMLLVVSGTLRHSREPMLPSSHTPSAPIIAKLMLEGTPIKPVPDVVRKITVADRLPSIILPQPGSVVASARLNFIWKQIPQARSYRVRVVKSDGDLVWEGETEESRLALPSNFRLKNGSYFVWITSYFANGRTIKSSPVSFSVKG
jgi:hypothetical protein